MINKHGRKMNGLKAAAGKTKGLQPRRWPYVQISYDRRTGDVITDVHCTLNEWTQYHSPDVVTVAKVKTYCTMQEIANLVHEGLENLERMGC